ncbi:GDP-L-fucose synthase [Tenacibaculum sp. MAR_2010_89]|uniref:GDP-L-fucose synthase family protein n=1 Tax=Tenacibaculum sp. MAR_2010_89 TaxID=1250198 RepID=UPI000898DFD6|nr:GDP-L-fucose synthase [Tenacibaculum sp. MAR_2010_89]SED97760.1 GDP-L-fucose synthase [Tenacibaculum sp. MAR_2010_89]
MDKLAKIFVAGHKGLVGSAILKRLLEKGYVNIITKTKEELDLTNQQATAGFFKSEKPEFVFLAAAKVGGIIANNTYRAEFIYDNLMIQNNVIHQSYVNDVKKLLFLGSTCIYPKNTEQPIKENSLLTGSLEYTNEPYAIAKIAGIKMCENYNIQYDTNFISVMPTNLYGPNDNFNLEKSHVLPALIRKIYLAKLLEDNQEEEVIKNVGVANLDEALVYLSKFGITKQQVEIWGSGKPKREFLWSDDMADACVFVMEKVNHKKTEQTHINIGTGEEISIKDLAVLIKKRIGFKGSLLFNTSKPDGTMRKITDVTKIHSLGWKHTVALEEGIDKMYEWYKQNNERR